MLGPTSLPGNPLATMPGPDLMGKEAARGTCHKCGGSLSRGNSDLAKQCGACGTRFHMSDCGGRLAAAGYHEEFDQCPKCRRLCQCAQGGLSLCHAYRVRKMRNKGRSRRLAAAANSADAASAEATSPTSPGAGADDDEVRQPFAASDRVGSRAGSGAGTGPSDADTTSGDVRLNMFASSEHVWGEGDEGFRGDGATTPVEARGVETLAMLDEQQLWAMGLLGDEQIETKNLSREGSAHSEIGYEPAAWVDSETCQLVPELGNELLELMHQKRARSTEPEDVDDYLVL